MRRAHKYPDSPILKESLRYKPKGDNTRIRQIILAEQKGFCAYTDEKLNETDESNLDHFNPNLKGTDKDGYDNWFMIKSKWNKKKGKKWIQPLLLPTAEDFEERIIYDKGDYITEISDVPANNLAKLLDLQNPVVADERKQYISQARSLIELYEQTPLKYFTDLVSTYLPGIKYPRAIREEFGVDIIAMLTG